ncbi:hypothetical protein ABBQ38_001707 [Trebouxia sp. C0009 RCD-2024]
MINLNISGHLAQALRRTPVDLMAFAQQQPEQARDMPSFGQANTANLWYAHGDVRNPGTVCLSTSDYNSKAPAFKDALLPWVLSGHHFLFIGANAGAFDSHFVQIYKAQLGQDDQYKQRQLERQQEAVQAGLPPRLEPPQFVVDHYMLVLQKDIDDGSIMSNMEKGAAQNDELLCWMKAHIHLVPYGDRFSALPYFLHQLAAACNFAQ